LVNNYKLQSILTDCRSVFKVAYASTQRNNS